MPLFPLFTLIEIHHCHCTVVFSNHIMERVEGRVLENPDRLSSCSITLCWLWQDDSFPTHAHELFSHRHQGLQEGHEESIHTSSPAHRLRDLSGWTRRPEHAPTFCARKVALVMPAVTCTLTSQLAPRSCPLGQLQSVSVSAALVFLLGQTSKLKAALLHLWSTRSRTAL